MRARIILASVALSSPASLRAQRTDSSTVRVRQAAVVRAMTQVEPGTLTRVSYGGHETTLSYRGIAWDSVVVASDRSRFSIAASSIDTVWVERRATGRGVVVGGLIGGFLLGTVGLALASSTLDGDRCNCNQMIPLGIVVGGMGGMLIGALAGSSRHVWNQVFP